ncbi:MAG: branched-chain amino acid ABC transporter permease, partial [Burkholderiales bacterium]
LALAGSALTILLGASAMIEMVYHLQLNEALGPNMKFLGATINAKGFDSWFGACFVMAVGIVLFELVRRQFVVEWGRTQEAIEKEIKKREAAL